MAEQSTEKSAADVRSEKSGLWVIVVIFAVSTAIAVFAAWRFSTSERDLKAAHQVFEEKGAELTVDECVDDVLDWREECTAMKSLCDSNVERMMAACLGARDRMAYCSSIGEAIGDAHFAAAACREHGLDRSERGPWKHCGMAYRAIDLHCRTLQESGS